MESKDKFLNECYTVQKNMIAHGGKFVFYIGNALAVADMKNSKALKRAFPEYWKQYLEW